MLKFIEFEIRESNKKTKLYAKLDNGSFVYITDYDYSYEYDMGLQFYRDEQGRFVDVYCHYGVSYEIRNGRLFKTAFNHNGEGWSEEVTLSMLDKCDDLEPVSSQSKSPFSL